MFVLVAYYSINVNYSKKSRKSNYTIRYKLKKYIDVYTKKEKVVVKAYFDRGYDSDLTANLQSFIVKDDKLTTIEVGRDNYIILSQENIDVQSILIFDRLNNKEVFVIPSKYDDNFYEYMKLRQGNQIDTSSNYYLDNKAKHISIKQFIDNFNKDCTYTNIISNQIQEINNVIEELKDNINFDNDLNADRFDAVEMSIENVRYEVNTQLSILKSIPKTTKEKSVITPENVMDQAIFYHNETKMTRCDIVETIQEMLRSSRYTLSDDFKKKKLDLKDIQFKFKMMVSPESISKDDILAEVFNIDNTVSLI
jgi:hypothetical protein